MHKHAFYASYREYINILFTTNSPFIPLATYRTLSALENLNSGASVARGTVQIFGEPRRNVI